MKCVTATAQEFQSKALALIDIARKGEEIVITHEGLAVARLTGLPSPKPSSDHHAWLQRLGTLRARLSTGVAGASVQQILDEDRGE
jgi:antitoxin (DNA-binding transcriptional repressor) of toxin-antitoxin stability system